VAEALAKKRAEDEEDDLKYKKWYQLYGGAPGQTTVTKMD